MKTVLVKGSGGGGLGDRIRAVLLGAAYAQASGRSLAVDWTDGVYAEPGVDAFAALFRLKGLVASPLSQACRAADVRPAAWEGRLGESLHQVWTADGNVAWDRADAIRRYETPLDRLDWPEETVVLWAFDQLARLRPQLGPDLADLEHEALNGVLWRRHLDVAPAVAARAGAIVPADGVRRVGVHFRATREADRLRGSVPITAAFAATDSLLGDLGATEVVLATDNADALAAFRARYSRVRAAEKWFAAPGEALHLNSTCPDLLAAAEDALTEILMIARCEGLVTQRDSSFSQVARILSVAPFEARRELAARQPIARRLSSGLRRRLLSVEPARR